MFSDHPVSRSQYVGPSKRKGVSRSLFALLIIILVISTSVGFALYVTKPSVVATVTSTQVVTKSTTVTTAIIPRARMDAIPFVPQYKQTIHDAWLLFAPSGNGTSYVLTVHAEGLLSSTGGGTGTYYYIVRGIKVNQTIEEVPLSGSIEGSRLQVDANGIGNYYTILAKNPELVYLAIDIARVYGSNNSLAAVIATATVTAPAAG